MTKRPAEAALEDTIPTESPLPKRARVDELPAQVKPSQVEAHKNGVAIVDVEDASNTPAAFQADDDDEDDDEQQETRTTAPAEGFSDLYLDTISRPRLDFDFEKLCSVTLSNINIYACLVCGKYFAGRGPKTPAYLHAVNVDHHVYINMQSKKVYVMPEGYEVKSKSLEDIKYVVDPTYTSAEVRLLDKVPKPAWDLGGKKYIPGYVGLNNIKANDYFNVIIQALAHVAPLRHFLMLEDFSSRPQLVQRTSILIRKIWNPRSFKCHVSPHELMQEISLVSGKKFNLTQQSDPIDFLSWLLNTIHLSLGGSKTKPQSSIIQQIFQGKVRIESQNITARADASDRLRFEDTEIKSQTSPYMVLTLDLPPPPLFQDDTDRNIIPQIPLTEVLRKYNGISAQERLNTRVRYRLLHPLPPYLIMHIKRFELNKFSGKQRNPTIVTFNPKALDMSPYVEPNPKLHPVSEPVIYDLVANITYEGVKIRDDSVEGEAEKKIWKVQVREGASLDQWWEMQDLFVEKVNADLLTTKEAYIMVWERRRQKK
ncbi:hypothetical protein AMS68_006803 [Peltaster fructicola]|uniref:USP domain-containing protein n=1 Tax=Peltaster fructicola TaxID=286661 RepID=A0A6H0Y2W0_9PEZI|nr:hypothetical protein AMS68_006803 [Peltaster fructicola]